MPSQRNSIFTPAMGPRGPGYTVGAAPGTTGLGAYLSGFSMPSWSGYAVIAGLIGLAALRKIQWPLALMGAGAAWWFLIPATPQLVNGSAILPSGQTIPLSQAALSTDNAGNRFITQNGVTYPVIDANPSPSGVMVYYLDSPLPATLGAFDPATGNYTQWKQTSARMSRGL